MSTSANGVMDSGASEFVVKYRAAINQLILGIVSNEEYSKQAKSVGIMPSSWVPFVIATRRSLMKDPESVLSPPAMTELCSHLDEMIASPSPSVETAASSAENAADTPAPPSSATERASSHFFKVLLSKAEVVFQDSIASHKALCNVSDLRVPHEWYPLSRLRRRKVFYHGGPTNSGKTYQALQRLKAADPEKGGGLYCGPLRLLALEVYESLNKSGVYCDLRTGQEQREIPFATHVSSTLEMVNLQREYDVVVIDEIQMIADAQRGYAWTKAILGLQANEIHLCGGLEAYEIVQMIMQKTQDDFELCKYERMSNLVIAEQSLKGDYSSVRKGDCVVAFSRKAIFAIKAEIERLTKFKCAVIYGQLPPDIRSAQARLFNDENTGYDILVASDAIGMGLNLNIGRIIFHTTLKQMGGNGGDGRNKPPMYWVEPSHVKQIAGRAGRRSSQYAVGEATAWQDMDLAYVRAVMGLDVPQIKAAGLFPSIEQIEMFSDILREATTKAIAAPSESEPDGATDATNSERHPEEDLEAAALELLRKKTDGDEDSEDDPDEAADAELEEATPGVPSLTNIRLSIILDRFVALSQLDGGHYFMCNHSDIVLTSNWLHTIPLTLAERFIFSNAPVNTRDALSMTQLYAFAAHYAMKRPVRLQIRLPNRIPRDVMEFSDLCVKHNVIDLYIWLSWRFPQFFVEREACLLQRAHAQNLIEQTLQDTATAFKEMRNSSLDNDYLKMRQALNQYSSEAYLPPADDHNFDAVRSSMKKNASFLQTLKPEFRRKSWKRASDMSIAEAGFAAKSKPGVKKEWKKASTGNNSSDQGAQQPSEQRAQGAPAVEIAVPLVGKNGLWKKVSKDNSVQNDTSNALNSSKAEGKRAAGAPVGAAIPPPASNTGVKSPVFKKVKKHSV